jgi:hypothetical protein
MDFTQDEWLGVLVGSSTSVKHRSLMRETSRVLKKGWMEVLKP